jgi:PAS domain S-box-containing protein
VKDENKTKEQLIDEIARLRQIIVELELAQKESCSSREFELPSPSNWFSTGRSESFVSNKNKQQTVNHPIKYKLSDLVDISLLKQLLDSFYVATGIPYGLHDENHNIISGKGWQNICVQFHRVCPQTECRCQQSDIYILDHLHDGPYVGYKCMNGLMDYGTPIIVEGQHLASIFLGQFLHELPDEEFFLRQAQEFGFDEATYMEALQRVPIIPEVRIESIMRFYSQLGQFLAIIGLKRKRQLELAEQVVKEQEERINRIWETSNDVYWEWNIQTGQVNCNPRCGKLFGHSITEIGQLIDKWKTIIHPDDCITMLNNFTEHLAGQTTKFEAEFRMQIKSGEWSWFMVRGQVVAKNKEGQPLRMVGIEIDITDRKKAQVALAQSEKKFFKAFHCNPDLMSISTLREGRYVEVNDAFVEITGFERYEVIGRSNQELNIWVVPEERERVVKLVQEHGSIRNIETKYRLKSGEIRTFNISVEIIDINDEAHLIVTTRDITQRKQMEEALRLSEDCFRTIFNSVNDAIFIHDLETGIILDVNQRTCELYGYSREEIVLLNAVSLSSNVLPYTPKYFTNRLKRAALGLPQLFQWQARNKDGRLFWVEVNLRRATIGDKKQIISAVRDITKRKQMEESLRLSEECLSKAFNTSPVLMAITTLEEGKFIKANNAFYNIVGLSQGEAIGKTSLEVGFWSNPTDRDRVKQMILSKQSIREMEISFCKNNGEQRLGLYSAEGLEIDGKPCIISVLTDITDLRQMEVEMNRLDRLNLVGEMAASIGHEIRNPMTTVRGYLQILRENKDYNNELEYFDLMIEELDRANSIITEFLSLAKNKRVDMKLKNINDIVSKALTLIQAKSISRDQNIRVELNEVTNLLLDEKEISQLILNMVNNALESMSSPGDVTVKTFMEQEKVVLAVKDQGEGIDRELLDKLGTPFFTTKEQGTGLGLAVCYRIANRHNAKIDIDTSSTGTTFYVRFSTPIAAD